MDELKALGGRQERLAGRINETLVAERKADERKKLEIIINEGFQLSTTCTDEAEQLLQSGNTYQAKVKLEKARKLWKNTTSLQRLLDEGTFWDSEGLSRSQETEYLCAVQRGLVFGPQC